MPDDALWAHWWPIETDVAWNEGVSIFYVNKIFSSLSNWAVTRRNSTGCQEITHLSPKMMFLWWPIHDIGQQVLDCFFLAQKQVKDKKCWIICLFALLIPALVSTVGCAHFLRLLLFLIGLRVTTFCLFWFGMCLLSRWSFASKSFTNPLTTNYFIYFHTFKLCASANHLMVVMERVDTWAFPRPKSAFFTSFQKMNSSLNYLSRLLMMKSLRKIGQKSVAIYMTLSWRRCKCKISGLNVKQQVS